jgi:hypothetical protein
MMSQLSPFLAFDPVVPTLLRKFFPHSIPPLSTAVYHSSIASRLHPPPLPQSTTQPRIVDNRCNSRYVRDPITMRAEERRSLIAQCAAVPLPLVTSARPLTRSSSHTVLQDVFIQHAILVSENIICLLFYHDILTWVLGWRCTVRLNHE